MALQVLVAGVHQATYGYRESVADSDLRSLIEKALRWRSETLVFLRTQHWVDGVAWMLAKGLVFPSLPASWAGLDRGEQARRLVHAEVARLEQARTFVFPPGLVGQLRGLAGQEDLAILPSEGTLPREPGFAVFAEPIGPDRDGTPVMALSWGPVHPEMSAGLIVTWWAAAQPGYPAPLMFADDMHVTYRPIIDARLTASDEWSEAERATAPTMRATVAALRLIARDKPAVRARTGKGKRREARPGPQVPGQAPEAFAALSEVVRAESRQWREQVVHLGGLTEPRERVPAISDPVFAEGAEARLEPGSRHWPAIYRDVAGQIAQLEQRAEQQHPGIFGYLEEIRTRAWGTWPNWCWMPVLEIARELRALHPGREAQELLHDAYALAALGALRAGGRVALLRPPHAHQHLDASPLQAPVPDPERALIPGLAVIDVYPEAEAAPAAHAGVFAFLDVHLDGRAQLYLLRYQWASGVLDGSHSFQLLLGERDVAAAGRATAAISLRPVREDGSRYTTAEVAEEIAAIAAAYIPELNAAFGSAPRGLADLAFTLKLRPHPPAWPSPEGTQAPVSLWIPSTAATA